jgi:hypothetical protein
MRGLPKTQRSAMKRACWTLGSGGAGVLGTMAIMHGPSAPLAIAVGAGAAVASNTIAELSVRAARNHRSAKRQEGRAHQGED